MEGLSTSDMVFSIVVTWGIGLAPPLLMRFVFFKRPLGRFTAIITCSILFFLNVMLFIFLGSTNKTHGALAIVALVSYWILTKETKMKDIIASGRRESAKKLETKESDYILCSNCKFEQWSGYSECQKCGANLSQ